MTKQKIIHFGVTKEKFVKDEAKLYILQSFHCTVMRAVSSITPGFTPHMGCYIFFFFNQKNHYNSRKLHIIFFSKIILRKFATPCHLHRLSFAGPPFIYQSPPTTPVTPTYNGCQRNLLSLIS